MNVTPLPLKTLESDHRDLAVFVYEDAGLAGAKVLTNAAKVALNAKLVLLLANHVGDMTVLRQAISAAKKK